MTRKFTNKLLDLIEENILDPKDVVVMCLKYMSEDEVEDMCMANEIFNDDEYEDEEDEDYDAQNEKRRLR